MPSIQAIKEDPIQEQILLAARQLFQQYGLHKVTMDDVARAIGKGRSSLYYYYKSKEEIFDAVMNAEIREALAEIALAVEQASTVEEKIKAFCLTRLNFSRKRRSLYNTMEAGMNADEMTSYTKVRYAVHRRYMKLESALLKQILAGGMEKGELHPLDGKDIDILVFVLLGSLHGLKREMAIENSFGRTVPAVNALTHLIMHGLKR